MLAFDMRFLPTTRAINQFDVRIGRTKAKVEGNANENANRSDSEQIWQQTTAVDAAVDDEKPTEHVDKRHIAITVGIHDSYPFRAQDSLVCHQ